MLPQQLRDTRPSKLEETKDKPNNDIKEPPITDIKNKRFSKRGRIDKSKSPTITTNSIPETISSLETAEKNENKDSCLK